MAPSSTGSPASRRFSKLIPFTVRPSFISRHGIILFARPPPTPGGAFSERLLFDVSFRIRSSHFLVPLILFFLHKSPCQLLLLCSLSLPTYIHHRYCLRRRWL